MNREVQYNVATTILGAIILIGIFYVVFSIINTLQAGFASITQAILTCK